MIQSAAQLFSTKIQTFAHRLYKEMGPEGGRNREIKVYTQTWLTADVNRPPGATCPSGGQNYVIEVCILMGLLEAAAELLVLLSPLWPQDMYGNLWGGAASEEHNTRLSTKRTSKNAGQKWSQYGQRSYTDHVWAWREHSPNHKKMTKLPLPFPTTDSNCSFFTNFIFGSVPVLPLFE